MNEVAMISVQGRGAIHVVPDVMRLKSASSRYFRTIRMHIRKPRRISDGW